jgi:hypothetical protein
MVEPEWKIEINPGEFVNLKGNINQVRSQALELNPRWEDNEGKESVSSNPEKRSPVWANIVCGPGPNNFEWASSMPLRMEAIPALRKWKGLPVLHWRTCAAVMCWQGNNIILCNDVSCISRDFVPFSVIITCTFIFLHTLSFTLVPLAKFGIKHMSV